MTQSFGTNGLLGFLNISVVRVTATSATVSVCRANRARETNNNFLPGSRSSGGCGDGIDNDW